MALSELRCRHCTKVIQSHIDEKLGGVNSVNPQITRFLYIHCPHCDTGMQLCIDYVSVVRIIR